MESTEDRRNVAVYRRLHPAIVPIMVGTVVWSVLALWAAFHDGGGTTLSLVVVTGFAIAFVGVPIVMWRASPESREKEGGSLATWLEGEFEADRGRISTKDAMAMVLLLPVASAVGLTSVAFVAWLAANGHI